MTKLNEMVEDQKVGVDQSRPPGCGRLDGIITNVKPIACLPGQSSFRRVTLVCGD